MATRQIVRSIKNVANGYSRPEIKVRNATSNDPWGPSGIDMDEIAQLTFHSDTFYDVMDMLDRRLNDKGKNWRHVMKALVVLDYLLHVGSEDVVHWSKENMYIIKTLREFQYIDEENNDQGMNVRTKAKEITRFLQDDEKIQTERENRLLMRDRLGYDDDFRSYNNERTPGRRRAATLPQRSSFDIEQDVETLRAAHESKVNTKKEEQAATRRARASTASAADGAQWQKEQREKQSQKEYLDQKNSELLFGAVRTDPQPQSQQQTGQPSGAPGIQQAQPTGYQAAPVQSARPTGYVTARQIAQPTGYQQPVYGPFQTTGGYAFANTSEQQRLPQQQYAHVTGPAQYLHGVSQSLTPQYTPSQQLQTYTGPVFAQPTGQLIPQFTAQTEMPQTVTYQLLARPQQQSQRQQPLVAYTG
ncbi:hypothetical protein V1525DRAFT_250584 [Lipomyces kononenkoae]|uniref:Uncharacterized protein n=1 Tax=Lipomyces kononenkoae TaxID=34357 RepID=A0ACC3SVU8_LIPKO